MFAPPRPPFSTVIPLIAARTFSRPDLSSATHLVVDELVSRLGGRVRLAVDPSVGFSQHRAPGVAELGLGFGPAPGLF